MRGRVIISALRLLIAAILWSWLSLPLTAHPGRDDDPQNVLTSNPVVSVMGAANATISNQPQIASSSQSDTCPTFCAECDGCCGSGSMACGNAPCGGSCAPAWTSANPAGLACVAERIGLWPQDQRLGGLAIEPHDKPPRV